MCSKPGPEELAARLRTMIDELAADASTGDADEELATRLASAWALLADADPDLAARTARYAPGVQPSHRNGPPTLSQSG